MNSKSRLRRWAMLRLSPVSRLSMPTTAWPRSRSVSESCDPIKPAATVTTVLGMGALKEAADDGEPHDLQIKRDRPVFDVVQVVFEDLLQRRVAAPAIHVSLSGA